MMRQGPLTDKVVVARKRTTGPTVGESLSSVISTAARLQSFVLSATEAVEVARVDAILNDLLDRVTEEIT